MPRPLKCRKIGCNPEFRFFKPEAVLAGELDVVVMSFDELEAIRLSDFDGLYQEEAAAQMHVSRQTFGNILVSARHKVCEMLITGKQLMITGGNIMVTSEERVFKCALCGHEWSLAHGIQRPETCPSCAGKNIHRLSPDGGFGGGRGGGGRCRGLRTGLSDHGKGVGNRGVCEAVPDGGSNEESRVPQTGKGENQ